MPKDKKKMTEEETEEILEKLKADEEQSQAEEENTDELTKLQQDFEKLNDSYLRLYADFDNYKKRVNKEKTEISAYALSDLIKKLIGVVDNFDRALATEENETPFYNGIRMVAKQLGEILSAEGLSPIKTLGETFDPNLHYAVMTDCDPQKGDDIIVEELQTGYMYKEKVLRPAMVKVNKL